jgi:hypothetical protein
MMLRLRHRQRKSKVARLIPLPFRPGKVARERNPEQPKPVDEQKKRMADAISGRVR